MTWFLLSLGSAIADAFQNLFRKKQVAKLDSVSLSWLLFLFSSVAFLPFLRQMPTDLSQLFWLVIVIRTVLDTGATYLFLRSVELADLSLSVPITALSPVFIVFIEFLLTGSVPSIVGLAGILMIVLGAYLLNVGVNDSGVLAPLRHMFMNKGVLLMLCVSVIWSVTSTLHRIAIQESGAGPYLSIGSLLLFASFTLVLVISRGRNAFSFASSKAMRENLPAGIFGILTNLMQMIAQGMFLASYVIAVKRMSILFSSVLGGMFLGEKLRHRLFPAVVMVAGVILLALS